MSVLQCKPSNYDTDVFTGLFEAVYQLRVEEHNRSGGKSAAPEKYGGRMPVEGGGKGDTLIPYVSFNILISSSNSRILFLARFNVPLHVVAMDLHRSSSAAFHFANSIAELLSPSFSVSVEAYKEPGCNMFFL